MYTNNEFCYDYSSQEFTTDQQPATTFPIVLPHLTIPNDHQEYSNMSSALMGYTSSGCSSYGGSPCSSVTSYNAFLQRSISTHSLHYSPMDSSPRTPTFFEPETSSVRKVLSTGDLQQGVNYLAQQQQQQRLSSPLANESSIIESMSRASPYSPEEKKERIERYRSKRNLRNFNKKIKYECRKTLADRRPRIRGRFARNDEIVLEKAPQSQWEGAGHVEDDDDEDEDNWINFLDPYSSSPMP